MSDNDETIIELAGRLFGDVLDPTTLEDPALVERLGSALAQALAAQEIDTVVVWSDSRTAVLGHVIARELGARLSYAYSDEGILSLSSEPGSASRIAVADYEWHPYPGLIPLVQMLSRYGTVAAVASVLPLSSQERREDLGSAAVVSLDDSPS